MYHMCACACTRVYYILYVFYIYINFGSFYSSLKYCYYFSIYINYWLFLLLIWMLVWLCIYINYWLFFAPPKFILFPLKTVFFEYKSPRIGSKTLCVEGQKFLETFLKINFIIILILSTYKGVIYNYNLVLKIDWLW